jgi:peptidoglycan/LPS O-acetylase OafA/YrhL
LEHRLHGRLRPWRFLGRRGFKIYPGFYALLLLTWLWFHPPSDKLLFEALFVQNYFGWLWNHTWSLAIEEHFYFALALLLWALARLRPGPDAFRELPKLCALVLPVVLALRVWRFSLRPHGYLLLPTHFRLDALLFGTLLAYYWAYERPRLTATVRRVSWPLAAVSVLLLSPSLLLPLKDSFVVNTIGLTANYLGFGGLVIIAVVTSQQDGWRLWRALTPMARLGFYSYSIYLWHSPVNYLTARSLPPVIGWPATLAVYFAGSVLAGVLMAKLIEVPFLRLRDRLLPSRSVVQPTAVAAQPLPTAALGAAGPDGSP